MSWPQIRDAGSFVIGAFILLEQTLQGVLFDRDPDVILVVTGFACLGVAGSSVATAILKRRLNGDDPR